MHLLLGSQCLCESYYLHLQLQAFHFATSEATHTKLLLAIALRVVVIPYRRFWTTCLSYKDGTDTLSRNVGKLLTLHAALITQKIAVLIYFAGETWTVTNHTRHRPHIPEDLDFQQYCRESFKTIKLFQFSFIRPSDLRRYLEEETNKRRIANFILKKERLQ
jgi:hypothetical protein